MEKDFGVYYNDEKIKCSNTYEVLYLYVGAIPQNDGYTYSPQKELLQFLKKIYI